MGDAAEDVLDGCCCQGCGEWFDDVIAGAEPPGYPRWCAACDPVAPHPMSTVTADAAQRRRR